MNIRHATEQDANGISLLNNAFGYEYSLEETIKKLQALAADQGIAFWLRNKRERLWAIST